MWRRQPSSHSGTSLNSGQVAACPLSAATGALLSMTRRSSLTVMDVPVIMQKRLRQWKCPRFSSSLELVNIPVRNRGGLSDFGSGGYGGDEGVLGPFSVIFRAPPDCPGVERQFSEPSMAKSSSSLRAPVHNSLDSVDINIVSSWSRLKQPQQPQQHTTTHNNTQQPPLWGAHRQWLDIPDMLQRRVPTVQTVQMTDEILQVPFLDWLLTCSLLCNATCTVHGRHGPRHPCRGAEAVLWS